MFIQNPKRMQSHPIYSKRPDRSGGFTMVELLIVIVIISVLMTLGTIGLGNMGGNPVNAGVATAEAIFDEARSTAIGKCVRAGVIVAKDLTNNPANDRRQLFVVHEEIDPNTGKPTTPGANPDWVLLNRGVVLPDQVFFSEALSKRDHSGTGALDTLMSGKITNAKAPHAGDYFLYEFNAEGICTTPGASFVIGRGARNLAVSATSQPPKVTASAKRDFSGFVIWRNGRTSLFNDPQQISASLPSVGANF